MLRLQSTFHFAQHLQIHLLAQNEIETHHSFLHAFAVTDNIQNYRVLLQDSVPRREFLPELKHGYNDSKLAWDGNLGSS